MMIISQLSKEYSSQLINNAYQLLSKMTQKSFSEIRGHNDLYNFCMHFWNNYKMQELSNPVDSTKRKNPSNHSEREEITKKIHQENGNFVNFVQQQNKSQIQQRN